MATRNISTRLAVTGESQYRASIQSVNAELKKMQSALKLTQSQFQTQANSLQALQAKHDALTKVQETQRKKVEELRKALENARSAEASYSKQKEDLKQKIESNSKALEALRKSTGDTTKEEAKLTEENARLQKELDGVESKLNAAQKGVNSWETQLNSAQIQLNNTDAELQKNQKYLDEATKSSDGCAKSIDEFGKEVGETSEELRTMGTILASDELRGSMQEIVGALTECTQAFMEFENGMAGVKRTTGIAGEELDALGDYFKTLSTEIPISTKELTDIATTAGQLGIKGSDNIKSFSTVMAKLATTTDLTADTAATMLAQFSNITHVSDYERLGSLVAALGDSTATTATKVVEMSQGLAAAASVAGMSEKDIMAISAAVGSLGIESAAGSTAMSTLISTIYKATQSGDKLAEFASISGMSSAQFKKAWEQDAVGALNSFITGLNDVERNGKSSVMLLDDLGIKNVRQTKAILGLAEAEGLLAGTILAANEAWEQNTALDEKAGIMFDTMKAKMETLENSTNNLKIAVGEALSPVIVELAGHGQEVIDKVTAFVEENPGLVQAIGVTAGAIAGITVAVAGVRAAWKAADFLGMTKPLKDIAASAKAAGGGISGLVTALGSMALPAATAATILASVAAVVDEINTVNTIGFLGEGHTLEEYAANVDFYKTRIEELKGEYESLAMWGGDLTMVENELGHAQVALSHATEEYAAAQNAASTAQEKGTVTTEAQTKEFEEAALATEAITARLGEVATAYKDAFDECKKSLDGQIGLFGLFSAEVATETDTASKMLMAWAQQTANLAMYTENLEKAAAYGLDSGLVASLADGSVQSSGYLHTIISEIENCANGTGTLGTSAEEAVAKFNAAFATTEEAKTNLAETMAEMQTDLVGSLQEMQTEAESVNFDGFWTAVDTAFADVGVNFKTIGTDMGTGLKTGIAESAADVSTAASEMATGAVTATKDAVQSHSPSKVFKQIGSDLDEGLALGIEENTARVETAATSMGDTVTRIMESSGIKASNAFVQNFRQAENGAQAALNNVRAAIMSAGSWWEADMSIIGANMVIGMINGVYSRSGMLSSAVASVVNQAIYAAKAAAAVRSPSRKTKEIFEQVGEGMIVGIEEKKEKVASATHDVVKDALVFSPNSIREMSRAVSNAVPDYGALLGDTNRSVRASEGKGKTYQIDKIEMTINTQDGQNPKEIAQYVMDMMQTELERKESAF